MAVSVYIVGMLGHDCLDGTKTVLHELLQQQNKKCVCLEVPGEAIPADTDVALIPITKEQCFLPPVHVPKFDCLMITDRMEDHSGKYFCKLMDLVDHAYNRLKENGIVIYNIDDKEMKKAISEKGKKSLGFGVSGEAYIAPSSIRDDIDAEEYMICLTGTFMDHTGEIKGPGEYKVLLREKIEDSNCVLAGTAFMIYFGYI